MRVSMGNYNNILSHRAPPHEGLVLTSVIESNSTKPKQSGNVSKIDIQDQSQDILPEQHKSIGNCIQEDSPIRQDVRSPNDAKKGDGTETKSPLSKSYQSVLNMRSIDKIVNMYKRKTQVMLGYARLTGQLNEFKSLNKS